MAIGPVVTRGYGTFGTVNLVATRGYTATAEPSTFLLLTGEVQRAPLFVGLAQSLYIGNGGVQRTPLFVANCQRNVIGNGITQTVVVLDGTARAGS